MNFENTTAFIMNYMSNRVQLFNAIYALYEKRQEEFNKVS